VPAAKVALSGDDQSGTKRSDRCSSSDQSADPAQESALSSALLSLRGVRACLRLPTSVEVGDPVVALFPAQVCPKPELLGCSQALAAVDEGVGPGSILRITPFGCRRRYALEQAEVVAPLGDPACKLMPVAQDGLVRDLDGAFAAGRVGDQQALIGEAVDQRQGFLRQLAAQCQAALRGGRGIVDAHKARDEAALCERVERCARLRQARHLRRLGESVLDGLADRAADALHSIHVLVLFELPILAMVLNQSLEGEGEQGQRVGAVEVGNQLFAELGIDADACAGKPRRPFDDLLEGCRRQPWQVEGQARNGRQAGVALQDAEAVGADGE